MNIHKCVYPSGRTMNRWWDQSLPKELPGLVASPNSLFRSSTTYVKQLGAALGEAGLLESITLSLLKVEPLRYPLPKSLNFIYVQTI